MKKKNLIFSALVLVLATVSCSSLQKGTDTILELNDEFNTSGNRKIEFSFTKGDAFNHPSFVIWVENLQGDYLKTLYITQSYAKGTFAYATLSDSTWTNEPGTSVQHAVLPYWTHKKGLIHNEVLVPTPKHPFVDAYTSATPKKSFVYKSRFSEMEKVRVLVEINQPWDWNKYWTNAKLNNKWYKNSAQPSIVYAVTASSNGEYYLNPIGHGNPTGDDGQLFTKLSTLTSAKNIFKEIKLNIE